MLTRTHSDHDGEGHGQCDVQVSGKEIAIDERAAGALGTGKHQSPARLNDGARDQSSRETVANVRDDR